MELKNWFECGWRLEGWWWTFV